MSYMNLELTDDIIACLSYSIAILITKCTILMLVFQ